MGLPVRLEEAEDARLILRREGLVAKSQERDRRPTEDELEALEAYWRHPRLRAMATPMVDIMRFAIASAMRLSEIVAIRWEDINEADRTVLIRNRKHPSKKVGNDQEVPLFPSRLGDRPAPAAGGRPRSFPSMRGQSRRTSPGP